MNDEDRLTDSIVKGIAYAENGGKPDLANPSAGKTGEAKSIFQFTPDTWKHDAGEFLGNANAPLNADNETFVMKQKVSKEVKAGRTVSQIASMHNAGAGEPDAYTGKFSDGSPSVGINKKYGVKFDVPSYAKKVLAYSKQFYGEKGSTQPKPKEDTLNQVINTVKQTTVKKPTGTLKGVSTGITPKRQGTKILKTGLLLNQKTS